MGVDVSGLLPTLGSSSDLLGSLAPFVSWLAPVFLVLGALYTLPLVAAGIGKMLGPDIEARAKGAFDEGWESGYLGAAHDDGEFSGRRAYEGMLSDYADED